MEITSNIGTISAYVYGIFIIISIICLWIAIKYIKDDKLESQKLDKIIELFKYTIVTVAISTATFIISDLFKERQQDVKELEYFDKYVNDVKKADNITTRLQLTKYLSIVAPSGDLKKSWQEYHKSVEEEYQFYLTNKAKYEKLDTLKNPTTTEKKLRDSLMLNVQNNESPLVSYEKSSSNDQNQARIWEQKGFEFLMDRNINDAIEAFYKSENASNGYHSVYEISKYLIKNHQRLTNKEDNYWKNAYEHIVKNYSFGMSSYTKDKLQNFSK